MNIRFLLFLLGLLLASAGMGAEPGKVSFIAAGDVMLARDVAALMRKEGPDAPFSGISPLLKSRDLAFCNLDFAITDRGAPREKGFLFRCPPDSAAGLVASGFNLFSLANNHIQDYGPVGLLDTRAFLEKHGFHGAGAAANAWEAMEPALLEKNGLRMAFFSFREKTAHGIKPRNPQVAAPDSEAAATAIQSARGKSDIVIVSYHWGEEFRHAPTAFQKRFGRICVDAGADLVLGHGPHALQPIEKYKDRYILHSLGNCVFDQSPPMANESVLFSCTLSKQGIADPILTPLLIRGFRPAPATGKDLLRIERNIRKFASGIDCRIVKDGPLLRLQ